MQGSSTDSARATMLLAAVAKVGRDELKGALGRCTGPALQAPKAVGNALNALRKHHDPTAVLGRAQYRVALPYLAAVLSDDCLAATIEALGDHSDGPTEEQLLEALDSVRATYSDVTIAVMLASVADGEMPASDLCFHMLSTDQRYGLAGASEANGANGSNGATEGTEATGVESAATGGHGPPVREGSAATAEQREARREKKQRDAEERRRKAEAARRAVEQVRRVKKLERSKAVASSAVARNERKPAPRGTAPRLTRRATLTPAQEEEFDRDDRWAGAVVFAWVPFDRVDPAQPDLAGKSRRCGVVAGSATHLLVRPGYSIGGVKSRDWKSVPLAHWRSAGFDQPTWIDVDMLRVERDVETAPVGWLSTEDWNALW